MANNLLSYKNLLISVIYSVIYMAIWLIIGQYNFLKIDFVSLIIGYAAALCNFYVILWAWSRIFLKKRIALASGVIVIKYAILVIFIYKIMQVEKLEIISIVIGISSIIIMVVSYSALQVFKKN